VLVQFCINDLNDPTLHFDAQTALHFSTIPDAAFPDPSLRTPSSELLSAVLPVCRRLRLCSLVDDAMLARRPAPDDTSELRALIGRETILPRTAAWLGEHYGELAKTAAGIGAGFAVVVFPDENQLEPAARAVVARQLVALGDKRGWLTIDLRPAFLAAAAASPEPLLLDPWHPSPTGHRVAADAILAGLRGALLLPAPASGAQGKK
jgi:hypothetical protein